MMDAGEEPPVRTSRQIRFEIGQPTRTRERSALASHS
jgi:hypothetical protein